MNNCVSDLHANHLFEWVWVSEQNSSNYEYKEAEWRKRTWITVLLITNFHRRMERGHREVATITTMTMTTTKTISPSHRIVRWVVDFLVSKRMAIVAVVAVTSVIGVTKLLLLLLVGKFAHEIQRQIIDVKMKLIIVAISMRTGLINANFVTTVGHR